MLIEGCHLWDGVTIEDDAHLQYSVVCDGATVKSGAILEPGVVLSFRVCDPSVARPHSGSRCSSFVHNVT